MDESIQNACDNPASLAAVERMKLLSPRRKTTEAVDLPGLVDEQLRHFGIDPRDRIGEALARIAAAALRIPSRPRSALAIDAGRNRRVSIAPTAIALFNAKKFLSFQLAKLLDTLQNPLRRTYQSLAYSPATQFGQGAVSRCSTM